MWINCNRKKTEGGRNCIKRNFKNQFKKIAIKATGTKYANEKKCRMKLKKKSNFINYFKLNK